MSLVITIFRRQSSKTLTLLVHVTRLKFKHIEISGRYLTPVFIDVRRIVPQGIQLKNIAP